LTVYPDLAFLLGCVSGFFFARLALRFLNLRRNVLSLMIFVALSGVWEGLLLFPRIPAPAVALLGIASVFFLLRGGTFVGTLRNVGDGVLIFLLFRGMHFLCVLLLFRAYVVFYASGVYFIASFWCALLSVVPAVLLLRTLLSFLKRRRRFGRILSCVISESGTEIMLRCYEDSGNLLRDPKEGLPVVIVEYGILRRTLRDLPPPHTFAFAERFGIRLRVMSCRFAAGEGQILYGFRPEKFSVEGYSCSAVIAVTERCLDGRGRFCGIVGSALSEGIGYVDFEKNRE